MSYLENGQESTTEQVVDSVVIEKINLGFEEELTEKVLTPETGFQRIRKILFRFRMDIPAIYDLDSEGDELVLDVTPLTEPIDDFSDYALYVIYSPTEDGYYEFYAELTDNEGIEDLLSQEGEEEVED
jgi:hypothetical protein